MPHQEGYVENKRRGGRSERDGCTIGTPCTEIWGSKGGRSPTATKDREVLEVPELEILGEVEGEGEVRRGRRPL